MKSSDKDAHLNDPPPGALSSNSPWRLLGWGLLALLFLFLVVGRLVVDGMFIDGVVYAAISNNLAHGIGSFWALKHSDHLFPVFYEHPPLMMGLQSLFFKVLGNGYGTERVYCLVITLLTMWRMMAIWQLVFKSDFCARWWPLPLIVWLVNEDAYLSYTANMLECTMTLFDLLSVECLLRGFYTKGSPQRVWQKAAAYLGGGLFVVLAFLTKGPTGMYPLAFFGAMALAQHPFRVGKPLLHTAVLTAITATLLGVILLYEPACTALGQYWNQQVMAALGGERTENIAPHRLYMLQRFFETHAHWLILLGLGSWWSWKKSGSVQGLFPKKNTLFVVLAAAALLPVMVSPKQAPHYMVPALPWIALALGRWAAGLIRPIPPFKMPAFLPYLAGLGLLMAVGFVFTQIGQVRADLKELKPLFAHIPPHETVGFFEERHQLVKTSYFQRYGFNDLDRFDFNHKYLIFEVGKNLPAHLANDYQRIDVIGSSYQLYQHVK